MLFQRSPANPILTPGAHWWDARAALNPGAALYEGRVVLAYRAVGSDGISRLALAWSSDGVHIDERPRLPLYEGALDDPMARLGVEDPRITQMDDAYYLTYTKASVETADHPPLSWEFAPFRVRSAVGRTRDFESMREIGIIAPHDNTKDGVLFPSRFGGNFGALIREFPSIQYITSPDLSYWTEPNLVMEPIPGTWEGERVGAGPPPVRTPWGWLLLYHGNEYLRMPSNERLYRMGLAVLDADEPWRVRYRHPEPIFSPEEPYEIEGPVGNVVFGTGLVEIGDTYYLYYGAGDGVIGVATAEREAVFALLRDAMGDIESNH